MWEYCPPAPQGDGDSRFRGDDVHGIVRAATTELGEFVMPSRSGGSRDGSQEAYTIDDVYAKVRRALCDFFKLDCDLLEVGVNERSITHKLAEHLQRQFSHLKVDCEYNRHGSYTKSLKNLRSCIKGGKLEADDSEATTVYPDIIVHQRGNDDRNQLVIEAKKNNNKGDLKKDRCKLQEFTNPHGDYGYKVGLLLIFDVVRKQISHVECFMEGGKRKDTVWDCLRGFP